MKKKNHFVLISSFFIVFSLLSCGTVKNLSDYDDLTFQKKNYYGEKFLGTVKVSTLSFVWQKYTPAYKGAAKLMQKLENKALKQYGRNIKIVDVDIGSIDKKSTAFLWGAGTVGFIGGAAAGGSAIEDKEVTDRYGRTKTESEVTNDALYGVGMGIACASLFTFLFKGVQATAAVIESDVSYEYDSYYLISEEDIYLRQNEYFRNKKEIDRLQAQKENKELINNLRNQLVFRAKNVNSPVAILNKKVYPTSKATDGISCRISFINISGNVAKYVKFDFTPYNRVFDQAYSHIDGSSNKTVTVTNFIGPNETYTAYWDNIWYNSSIGSMKLTKVEMIFSDNTTLVIDDPKALSKIEFSADEQGQYDRFATE